MGGVTLPGNSDVHITGPDIAPDGNSFALSCSCLDFMKSDYQMNPNFPDNVRKIDGLKIATNVKETENKEMKIQGKNGVFVFA